jgi:hypothetical protein
MSIEGQTVTMHLFHFTAPAVTPDPLTPFVGLGSCFKADELETEIGVDVTISDVGERRNKLTNDLRDCYQNYVAPTLHGALTHLLDNDWQDEGLSAYNHWIYALVDAASAVGSQAFTVSPEVADAKTTAVTLVQGWYEAKNQDCVAHKNDPAVGVPIFAAIQAMSLGWDTAHEWGFDTAANGLDLETALNKLCVQVVIDPNRSYSATGPGTTGDVKVNVGITIAGGPLRFAKAHVTVKRTGTDAASADGQTDAQGNFMGAVPWPTGMDPIQIDILAELDSPGTELASLVARFDRITKHSGSPGPSPTATAAAGFTVGLALPGPYTTCSVVVFQALAPDGITPAGNGFLTWRLKSGPPTRRPFGVGLVSYVAQLLTGPTPGTYVVEATANGVSVTGSVTTVHRAGLTC